MPESEAKQPTVAELQQRRADLAGQLIAQGKPISQALREAGYSDGLAVRGKAALSAPIRQAIKRHGGDLDLIGRTKKASQAIELGKSLPAGDRANLVRGLAIDRALKGSDKGHKMLELIGKDREVNMFAPDAVLGLAVNINLLDSLESPDNSTVITPLESDD